MHRHLFQRFDLCSLPPSQLFVLLRQHSSTTQFLTHLTRQYVVSNVTCIFFFSKLFGPNCLKSCSVMCSCIPSAFCAKWCTPVFVHRVIRDVLLSGNRCVDFGTRLQVPKATPHCFDSAQTPLFNSSLSSTCSGGASQTSGYEQMFIGSFHLATQMNIVPLFCQCLLPGNVGKPTQLSFTVIAALTAHCVNVHAARLSLSHLWSALNVWKINTRACFSTSLMDVSQ